MIYYTLTICILAVSCSAKDIDPEAPLPDFFKICGRDDQARDECIRDSITAILPALKGGYKPLEIPPIDPMNTPKFRITHNIGNIKGTIQGKDNVVHGSSNAKIKAVRTKITDNTLDMEVDVFYDKLAFEGNYKFDGGINLFQISAKGHFNITMLGITATWKVMGELVERSGEKYMEIKHTEMTPEPTDVKIDATNIFPDPEVNAAFLVAMNQNWRATYKEATPILQSLWGPPLMQAMNHVFTKVPFRRLMPTATP